MAVRANHGEVVQRIYSRGILLAKLLLVVNLQYPDASPIQNLGKVNAADHAHALGRIQGRPFSL